MNNKAQFKPLKKAVHAIPMLYAEAFAGSNNKEFVVELYKDARLLETAAPAMYEALQGCLRVAEAHLHDTLARWEDYEGKVPSGIAELDAARMEVVRIQNALAQAEGVRHE